MGRSPSPSSSKSHHHHRHHKKKSKRERKSSSPPPPEYDPNPKKKIKTERYDDNDDSYKQDHRQGSSRNYRETSSSSSNSGDEYRRKSKHKKKKHRHSDKVRIKKEPEDDQDLQDEGFNMKKFKSYFDRMFFRTSDIIQKGTTQYDDFWKFYDRVQKRFGDSGYKGKDSKMKNIGIDRVCIPEEFSKSHTIPFKLKYSTAEDFISNLTPDDQEIVRRNVPKNVILDLIQMILLHLNLLQSERFKKMKKLRETQSALPISRHRDEILQKLEETNVLIIAGDTGCGKSTQLPQYLLKAGYTNIACTQPRRIACISLCKRVAFETLNEFGTEIGYQIRFEKSKTQHTKIVFLTEGLLLRQVSTDSMLNYYNVIVLDEIHERHLHGDFLLGILKCLLYQRSDIKIILMSATINTQLFQNYFQGLAPIIQVPGRLFPIKTHYRGTMGGDLKTKSGKLDPGPFIRILQLIDDKFAAEERGDVLVFLSGLQEITIVEEAAKLYASQNNRWIILPLHSMLSIDDQDKVFDYPPEGIRKCILSTNIAETSITIDGIRFVVDSGKVKEMAYDPTCKMQRLKEFWISKASAEQRKGRAGRTGAGTAYRIFSEKDYDQMQDYSTPEIQRVPLDSLLLQMIYIGIPDCRKFPFIEPPSLDSVESSIMRLKEQGALTDDENLTPIGKTLSQLPVDVTIGKVLLMGVIFESIDSVLSLASALSVQSPFTNYAHRDQDCVAARKSLDSDHGDPITLLNAYREWLEEKSESGNSRKWCKKRGFEEQRFYEMTKLRHQFKSLLKDSGILKDVKEGQVQSSAMRAMRFGELKQLKSIKREHNLLAPRKRKYLKITNYECDNPEEGEEGEEDNELDLRDVDFRIRNDHKQVKDLVNQSTPYGHQDLLMLKVILTSGIYPSVGIADDFNKHKKETSEQLFHTRGKGFTVLHPMSIFANCPEVLRLNDSDVILVPHMASKLDVSSKHQLVCYLNLLETNKPYLMNTLRMPALQTLFLFGHAIDTDPTLTRFVFDSWLEIEFTDSASARTVIILATELRDCWSQLLAERLSQTNDELPKDHIRQSRELSRGLVKFLQSETFYTIRRLLAADQKHLYSPHYKPTLPTRDENPPFEKSWEFTHNNVRGGINLTSYLTYASLCGSVPELEEWTCPYCEIDMMYSEPLNLLLHQAKCKKEKQSANDARDSAEALEDQDEFTSREGKTNAKTYFCDICQKNFTNLTPMEILRHKKSHV